MNLSSASATTGLSVRAVPVSATLPGAGKRLTASATIGSQATVSYPDADIAYAVTITADDAADVASLDLLLAAFSADTGSPTAVGAGNDFQGIAIPAADTLFALVLSAPSGNAAAVAVAYAINEFAGAIELYPGMRVVLSFATAGVGLAALDAVTATFATAEDELTVEVLAQAGTV